MDGSSSPIPTFGPSPDGRAASEPVHQHEHSQNVRDKTESNYQDCNTYYISREGKLTYGKVSPPEAEHVPAVRPEDPQLTLMLLDGCVEVQEITVPSSPINTKTPPQKSSANNVRIATHGALKGLAADTLERTKDLSNKASTDRAETKTTLEIHPSYPEMPDQYKQELGRFCNNCKDLTSKIIWRNFGAIESRYESRFRGFPEKNMKSICYLQFHTMHVPYLDSQPLILAMVHHVHIKDKNKIEKLTNKDEKIFICMLGLGLDNEKVRELLGETLMAYQENAYLEDPIQKGQSNDIENNKTIYEGVTPKLFVAAILKQYGFEAAKEHIREGFKKLRKVNSNLEEAGNLLLQYTSLTAGLEGAGEDLNKNVRREDVKPKDSRTEDQNARPEDQDAKLKDTRSNDMGQNQSKKLSAINILMQNCIELSQELNFLLVELTGVRSRVHYIGLCARSLVREESEIERYITESWYRFRPVSSTDKNDDQKIEGSENSNAPKNRNASRGGDSTQGGATTHDGNNPSREVNHQKSEASKKRARRILDELEMALEDLNSTIYTRRDNDKLEMISRAMMQYEVDIKSLKSHATIAIGVAANLHSQALLAVADRDSAAMKTVSIMTILFLPATFFAIVLTTPMISWAPQLDPTDKSYRSVYKGPPTFIPRAFGTWFGFSLLFTIIIGYFLWPKGQFKEDLKSILELIKRICVGIADFCRSTKQGAQGNLYGNGSADHEDSLSKYQESLDGRSIHSDPDLKTSQDHSKHSVSILERVCRMVGMSPRPRRNNTLPAPSYPTGSDKNSYEMGQPRKPSTTQ